jgi:hypothetical protein
MPVCACLTITNSDRSYVTTLNGSLTVTGNISGSIYLTVDDATYTLSDWLTALRARLMIRMSAIHSPSSPPTVLLLLHFVDLATLSFMSSFGLLCSLCVVG